MSFVEKDSSKRALVRNVRDPVLGVATLTWLIIGVLFCNFPAQAQSQQQSPAVESGLPDAPGIQASAGDQLPDHQWSGSISGTIADRTGAVVAGARVTLTREDQSTTQEVRSGNDGQFSFANIASGPFHLTFTSEGFATQAFSATLRSGEIYVVPQITLAVATALSEVQAVVSREEVAEEQIKDQEKQRVLGFIPNFYVSYIPDAAPLTSKQKFELAWRTTLDPITFVLTGAIAGVQQAQNDFSGYGQGAQGYAKRYGAAYADFATSTFIGSAILPSLLKQDPRYFYKGTGSKRSRILYAVANSVICKGDNGRWQANYSSILGGLAAGGISNLYYPAKDRGVGLMFENALIGIGATAAANVLQEFLVRKLTPSVSDHDSSKP